MSADHTRAPVVVLCGSTRFVDDFNHWRRHFTMIGFIVVGIEIVTTQSAEDDPQHVAPEQKYLLDWLHLRKIDMADFVFVINRGGYIGDSTRAEIRYAQGHNKPITYSEAPE